MFCPLFPFPSLRALRGSVVSRRLLVNPYVWPLQKHELAQFPAGNG